MQIIDIDDAEIRLSRLVDQAAGGESFVIAKRGKPLVNVVALNTPTADQTACRGLSCR